MRRIIFMVAVVVALVSACGSSSSSSSESTTTSTTAATTTTSAARPRTEMVMVSDPVTGRTMSFAEFIGVRGLTHVDTRYGDVWLDRIKGDQLFPDGVAFMVENCGDLNAKDLERTEQILALTLVCYDE